MTPALVIGLGQRDRGDDAAGPAVADLVRGLCPDTVSVIELADPAGLLDAWACADLVVVVDAVRAGLVPGTVQVLHTCHGRLPVGRAGGDTHSFGLAEAVELARALGRMPPELVIVGVEAEHFRLGEPVSEPVRTAVGMAARVVAEIIHADRDGQ